jgi:Mn-dependent DtxR family transcriptional regulator
MTDCEEFYTARGYEISAGENELTPSMEDYIEMIYRESLKTGYVRVSDLAVRLNVQPPSVSKMMAKLQEKSLLKYEKYGMIHLSEEGLKLGKFFLERHNTLKLFLKHLGVVINLQKDVEQMEHHISWETFTALSSFVSFLQKNEEVLQAFSRYKEEKQPKLKRP